MQPEKITTIVFDLGGVIVELSGASTLCDWARDPLTPEQLLAQWLASSAVRSFESGLISYPEFRSQLKAEFKLDVSDREYDETFVGWITRMYPGAAETLRQLKQRFTVACFSNTNEVHWEKMRDEYDLFAYFERRFASFEMGLVKPDRAAFDYVLGALDCPAETILFFDDSPANVAAAEACGIQARCVKGIDGVREVLAREGLF